MSLAKSTADSDCFAGFPEIFSRDKKKFPHPIASPASRGESGEGAHPSCLSPRSPNCAKNLLSIFRRTLVPNSISLVSGQDMPFTRTTKTKWRKRPESTSSACTTTTDIRVQPSILRRKRKAESEFEMPFSPESDTSGSCTPDFSEESHPSLVGGSSPIHSVAFLTPSSLLTPVNNDRQHNYQFRVLSNVQTPEIVTRSSPLPAFSWAETDEVWALMVEKDSAYLRNANSMTRHPNLHHKMRSILLDWLMEVCEVYALHRATFYLAQDFVDRFLATQADIPKQQLQLLGITCLFIAAKLEEIYPPKLAEFAFVTDGACKEDEIIQKELVILKILNWDLTPMTINSWLNVYMQCISNTVKTGETQDDFIFPDYSTQIFIQTSEILDLCVLDIDCLRFSYSVLAAAALIHITSHERALSASGFKWDDVSDCVAWMASFYQTIKDQGFHCLMTFKNVPKREAHYIQTHSLDLELFERAQNRVVEYQPPTNQSQPFINQSQPCHLVSTTPRSSKKPRKTAHPTPEIIQID